MALSPELAAFDKDGNGKLEGAEVTEYTAELLKGIQATEKTNNAKSGTSLTSTKIELTTNTARALMQLSAENAGYTGKFSSADVAQFIKEFDKEQARQIEKVKVSTASKLTPGGTTPGAVDKAIESTARTEFPSFFNPAQFAQDWVWNKVNFKDEKTLGAKSLETLSQVRGLVDSFQLLGVSDAEAKVAAKQIAMGKKTLAEYTVELQKIAMKEYPQFADRFKLDPTLTTYDIASPAIDIVAQVLEIDKKSVKLDHPVVRAYTDYAGPDGKGTPPSRYQLKLMAKKLPAYKETEQANVEARNSAESLGKALGFGI
jgi:hypothetical protein